jgi:hypothetical protein
MATWQAHHQELLRFYNRNPQRCLLVDAQACADNPSALIEQCNKQWKLRLTIDGEPNTLPSADPLARYLAQKLCNNYPLASSLEAELIATMTPLASRQQSEAHTAKDIISSYREALNNSEKREQVASLEVKNQGLETQLDLMQENLENYNLKLQSAQAQVIQAQNDQKKASEQIITSTSKNNELEQENQLLLLQLHQVQEELESNFVQDQNTQNQLTQAQKDHKQVSEQVKASTTRNSELEQEK